VESQGIHLVRYVLAIGILSLCLFGGCETQGPRACEGDPPQRGSKQARAFHEAMQLPWEVVLCDGGSGDWKKRWFLDGKKARVINTAEGMALHAGPNAGEDASHAVLWTKASFRAPIKIEYDYTRLDQSGYGVNILYLLATGSGEPPYATDITQWSELRAVPAMRAYVHNMHLYHISYAAKTYDQETRQPTGNDYVRARRYMPHTNTLRDTQVGADYRGTGLFRQGVPHHIVVIKAGRWLFMEATNAEQRRLFAFDTTRSPAVTQGRVGFRQMYTRSARYSNITISQLDD